MYFSKFILSEKTILPSPWFTGTSNWEPSIPLKKGELDLLIFTWTNLASNLSLTFFSNLGQWFAPGIISFNSAITWQPLQIPNAKVSSLLKKLENWLKRFELDLMDCAQPLPAPRTSPYENPPGNAIPWKLFRLEKPLIRSLMWRSITLNPAWENAAAISTLEFTPWSRIIPIVGEGFLKLFLKLIFDTCLSLERFLLSKYVCSSVVVFLLSLSNFIFRDTLDQECISFLKVSFISCFLVLSLNRSESFVIPTLNNELLKPNLFILFLKSKKSCFFIWNKIPNSSENNDCSFSKDLILDISKLKPHPPANIISIAVVTRPPSETSWKENIFFLLIWFAR